MLSLVHMQDLVVVWGLPLFPVPLNSSYEHPSTQLDSHKERVKESLQCLQGSHI